MDSETTTPAAPAAMLQNATIDKAEKSEFTNSARDTIKLTVNLNNYNFTKEGENLVLESSDVIDCLRNAVPLILTEVRNNDQSRSTVSKTTAADGSDPVPQVITTDHNVDGDPVKIIDLVPSEPSSLPIASVADLYTRSMLKCLAGYPLYEPQPLSELSTEYLRHGVNVGDVGFVREDGIFDFLFNICPSKNGLINPPNLPYDFSLETAEHSATRAARALSRKTCLFKSPVVKLDTGEYICEGSEGAILELPEGAIQEEAMNKRPFTKLAARHGVQWYEYTMARGREISNGSLYLITSPTRCTQWGIALFDRPCPPGQGLKFDKKRSLPFGKSTSKYRWKGSRAFPTKISDSNEGDAPNQCVFLRGYKIMIRQDIFDNLCNDQPHRTDPAISSSSSKAENITLTRQPATRIRGGGGSDPMSKKLTVGGLLSPTTMPTMTSDKVALRSNLNSSLVHPSDFVNVALLSQNPDAKVALTHDDVWCDLLRDNFPKLSYATLINIARSYTIIVDEYDCVTLDKISDSSSVLDESNRPLEATEIPALQALHTTPDDHYPALPATISVTQTLPHELVEHILLLLDTEYMLRCRLVNREFNDIIQSSTVLQYFLGCKAAGVIDNPQSPLSYAERLDALNKREDAWRKLKPVYEITISVKNKIRAQICRQTEGVCFLTDDSRKELVYCRLTSFPQDEPRWIRMPVHGPALKSGILVDHATALYEHDLIVNFISSDVENRADRQRLDLILLKFSNGEYHPLARRPRIHVQRFPEAKFRLASRIVGDNLALIVHSTTGTFLDKLFIFDWKTGHKLLQHEAQWDAYSDLVFVSPELLLVPNCALYHFEVWHLPPHQFNPKPPIQILSLRIPTISSGYTLSSFSCYGEPNPFLHSMPYLPPQPFFSSPENSIIVVRFNMLVYEGRNPTYDFIMHRRGLLDMIQTWTSPSLLEQQEELPTWLTNEFTAHQIADPEDGSVELDVQSKLISTIPHPKSTDSGSSSVPSGSSTNSAASLCTFLQVPWAKWGPSISRWFRVNFRSPFSPAWWNNGHSNGQRCAFSYPNPLDTKRSMVSVVDFNPHNFRRNAEIMTRLRSGEGEDNSSNDNNEKGKEEKELLLDHEGMFSEEVYMGLKCVVYRAPEYDCDLVFMDEQRLLGVKFDSLRKVESIKVLYIG